MKKIFTTLTVVLTILFFPFISKAQTTYEDVVYLKNGSVIRGMIIEQIPNQSIKIQTRDGNIFVYKIEEIEKITKEQKSQTGNSNFSSDEIKQSGYTNITETNFGIGVGDDAGDFSYGIQTINGYLINPNFSIGLGIGIDKYKNSTFLPIFADLRVNFLKTTVTPFLSVAIGYSLGLGDNKGGLLINPSLGVKFSALNFSIGYRMQKNSFDYLYYSFEETGTYLNFRFGVTF